LGNRAIEGDEFLGSRVAASLQSLDFADPAVESGLCDAVLKVANDLNEAPTLFGVNAEHGAPDTGVLVLAWRPVGPTAGAQLEFAFVEVLSELGPFFLGRFTIFGFWTNASPVVKIRPVRTDHLVREDRQVVLRSLKTGVAKHFGSDVDGQSSGHRFSSEQPESRVAETALVDPRHL
jgi:hypothetical protein